MPWVKVDTRFPTHEKVLDIGPVAEALWLRGLCYAGDHRTDGFVPAAFVRRMGDLDGAGEASRLVAAGLWHDAEGGWAIHEYLTWQSSKTHMDDVSAKRAEAGRRGGLKRAESAAQIAAQANVKQIASKQRSKRQAEQEVEVEVEDVENPPTPLRKTPATPDASGDPWYAVFLAVCDENGQDPASFKGKARSDQLAAAKVVAAAGVDEAGARRLFHWLSPQPWVVKGGGVDLRLMAGQVGKWTMKGRPDAPPIYTPGSETLARPNGSTVVDRMVPTPEEQEAARERTRQHMAALDTARPAPSAADRSTPPR